MIAMMASCPVIMERIKHWDEKVEKSNYVIDQILRIEGNKNQSEYPKKHTLTKVDTRQSFDKIAHTHKRKGWFLSDELERRSIVGQFAGATMAWRLNIYGLN